MMYPTRSTERRRATVMLLMLLSFVPVVIMFLAEFYNSFRNRDLDNITRQTTIGLPLLFIVLKMVLTYVQRRDFELILDEISVDLLSYNDLSVDCLPILEQYMKSGLLAQKKWVIVSIVVTGIFPLMAAVLMVNHNLKHNEVKRYMIHEMNVPHLEDRIYDSPYFEIVFAYMLYLCLYFTVNFTGYDGTFCVCVNHGSLKFKLVTHRLKTIFENIDLDIETIVSEMKKVIVEHQKAFEYVNHLQAMYGPWLGMIFLGTLIQICMTLYQITQVDSFDPKYLIFVVGSIYHIYLPCNFAAVLQQTAMCSSTEIYCCGWERVMHPWVTHTVRFMIARAQRPVILSGMGMVTFDMLLFVSILRTSYSIYTLIT